MYLPRILVWNAFNFNQKIIDLLIWGSVGDTKEDFLSTFDVDEMWWFLTILLNLQRIKLKDVFIYV